MASITICSDFGTPKNKVWHCFHCFPIYLWILYHGATMEALRHILDSSFPHMYLVKEAGIKRPGSWESSAQFWLCYQKLWGLWQAPQLPWDCFLPSEMPCCGNVAHQAPLSLGFLRPEYWRGCHFLLYKIAF